MIDVSRFRRGDKCPRCPGRRVYAIDEGADMWRCVPNAVVEPWRLDQVRQHDSLNDESDVELKAAP